MRKRRYIDLAWCDAAVPETDSLYIELGGQPGAETREMASGLNVDFDTQGEVVGLDLTTPETVALPLRTIAAA